MGEENQKKNFINIEGKEYTLSPKTMDEFNSLMEVAALIVAVSFGSLTEGMKSDPQKRLAEVNQDIAKFSKQVRAKFANLFIVEPPKEGSDA